MELEIHKLLKNGLHSHTGRHAIPEDGLVMIATMTTVR